MHLKKCEKDDVPGVLHILISLFIILMTFSIILFYNSHREYSAEELHLLKVTIAHRIIKHYYCSQLKVIIMTWYNRL